MVGKLVSVEDLGDNCQHSRLTSPRSLEACRRHGVNPSELFRPSSSFFRKSEDEDNQVVGLRAERHEVARRRLLRQVRAERWKIVRREQGYPPAMKTNQSKTPTEDRGLTSSATSPALEEEAHRLAALKKRQATEFQQLLAYELRNLAREERSRRRVAESARREAEAEARRNKRKKAAEHARLDRDRRALEKERLHAKADALKRAAEELAERRLQNEEMLREEQAQEASRRRAEEAGRKATVLRERLARGSEERRRVQQAKEDEAARREAEREASAEAARRTREQEAAARAAAAAERVAAVQAAVEQARKKRNQELERKRVEGEGRATELDTRAALFRQRRKAQAMEEVARHEAQAAEAVRARQKAARERIEAEAERRRRAMENRAEQERALVLAAEARKEQEARQRQHETRLRQEKMRQAIDRRKQAEDERREQTLHKLEANAAKVDLMKAERGRIKQDRQRLNQKRSQQREALRSHFEKIRTQGHGKVDFGTIAAALREVQLVPGSTQHEGPESRDRRAETRKQRKEQKQGSIQAPEYCHGSEQGSVARVPCPPSSPCPSSHRAPLSGVSRGRGGGHPHTTRVDEDPYINVGDAKVPAPYPGSAARPATDPIMNLKRRYRNAVPNAYVAGAARRRRQLRKPPLDPGDSAAVAPRREKDSHYGVVDSTPRVHGGTRNDDVNGGRTCREKGSEGEEGISDWESSSVATSREVREKYNRELLALLEKEQAVESEREAVLSRVKGQARAATARAVDARSDSGEGHLDVDSKDPVESMREGQGRQAGRAQQLQAEADILTEEVARLERVFADERREASKRVMKVSEEYEAALAKIVEDSVPVSFI